jgi:copper chaperone CopZ
VLILNANEQRFSDIEATNVKEDFEDVAQWSIGSWVEEVKVDLEEQVAFSDSQIKAAALKELIKKLEAQNIYDFR